MAQNFESVGFSKSLPVASGDISFIHVVQPGVQMYGGIDVVEETVLYPVEVDKVLGLVDCPPLGLTEELTIIFVEGVGLLEGTGGGDFGLKKSIFEAM